MAAGGAAAAAVNPFALGGLGGQFLFIRRRAAGLRQRLCGWDSWKLIEFLLVFCHIVEGGKVCWPGFNCTILWCTVQREKG